MKKVLFYSSVSSTDLFNIQQFYVIDASILKSLGYEVVFSNKIRDAWRFWKYDMIFGYFFRKSFFVALIGRIFGKKVWLTGGIDSLDKNHASVKEYRIQKLLLQLCDKVVSKSLIVSQSDWQHAKEVLKSDRKLVLSEHTIDTKPYREEVKKDNIFLTIGWMANEGNVRRKGMDTAIRVFGRLKQTKQFKDYKLLIIGKLGDGTKYLEKIIKELALEGSVKFIGSVSEPDKIEFLKRSKYYFQLSRYEGFGLAALEALCARNILIHSGKGGLANPKYSGEVLFDIDANFDDQIELLKNDLTCHTRMGDDQWADIMHYFDNSRRRDEINEVLKSD